MEIKGEGMQRIEGNIEINDNPIIKPSNFVEENHVENDSNHQNDLVDKNNSDNQGIPYNTENTLSSPNISGPNATEMNFIDNKKDFIGALTNNMSQKNSLNEAEENNITENYYMTLDESVLDSLKRDVFRIYNKLKHVITPRLKSHKIEELYNWDLWGPLIFCFLLSVSLSHGNNSDNESSIFVLIFTIFWLGGLVVTFNAKFLGAQISICQTICLLGYCMFPITVGGIVISFGHIHNAYIKVMIVLVTFIWACFASFGFFSALIEKDKILIAVIPVILFFLSLSLFVLNY